LSRKSVSEIYASFLGEEAVDSYLRSVAVEHYLAEKVTRSIVLVAEGAVVGYSVPNQDLIDLMMIDAGYHRRGLGTVLLRHVEDTLIRIHRSLRLESFEENAVANSFYRKNGWVEVRQFTDEQSGIEKIEFQKSQRKWR
jgi:GNAT superfamily N-acetyltransferase